MAAEKLDQQHPEAADLPSSPPSRPRNQGQFLVVLGGVVVIAMAGALAGPWSPKTRDLPEPDYENPTLSPEELEQQQLELEEQLAALDAVEFPDLTWLLWLLFAFLVVVAIILLGRGVRALVRGLQKPASPEELDEQLDTLLGVQSTTAVDPELAEQAVRKGLIKAVAELEAHGEPRDAVIAAWLQLELAAKGEGLVRDPASTPTEFTMAVLRATKANPETGERLLEVYLLARFSEHPVLGPHVAQARAALEELRKELGQ